jgi:acetophenone carboxylase
MIATGIMSAVHNCFAKATFATTNWRQAGASMANAGNALVLAGLSQWGVPFADMLAYSINSEGQGARPDQDGMDAYGFPWAHGGRAPNTENVENEFPLLIPLSNHWIDSCGHGKFRGGVGTVQIWVAHHVPQVFMMSIADNTKLQTPQPLFGGYAPCTVPGISIRNSKILEQLAGKRPDLTLELRDILERRTVEGEYQTEFLGRSVRPYANGEVITFGFSAGGTGYGDPLERDTAAIAADIEKGIVTAATARSIYKIVWDDENRRIDEESTAAVRKAELEARIKRGKPYAEFEKEWSKKKPPEEILTYYGSWPDAKARSALVRA